MSINHTSRPKLRGTHLPKIFKKLCEKAGKKSNPSHVKLCTDRRITGHFYSHLRRVNALRVLHEFCTPSLAAKLEPQAALCPLQDIIVEPVAFRRKLLVTGCSQVRLGKNNSPQSGDRAGRRWHRLANVSMKAAARSR